MFHRIFEEGLAHSSYVVACDRTRLAAVVDPRRDVDVYVELAAQRGLTITHAIDTHIHADFVSGARELSECGARVIAGPGARLDFPSDEVQDGDVLAIGDVRVHTLHTPGHTPEHISLLFREGDTDRVLTGDTLFVGAVGRPDLLGEEQSRELAARLHASLMHKLLALPDSVEVHPGHGAGSLCGTAIGSAPHSTIGHERRHNPMLQHQSREAFVDAVLHDLPETPAYFAELKRVNRLGPPLLGLASGVPPLPAVAPQEAESAVRDGAVLIDLRSSDAFAEGHPAGAVSIAFGARVGYWAGWVLPKAPRVVLLSDGDARHIEEAHRQLLRVGIDRVEGFVRGGFPAWRAAALPVSQLRRIPAGELVARHAEPALVVIDVRSVPEFAAGHAEGAINIPVGNLSVQTQRMPRSAGLALMCESGFRSTLAASLLVRAGFSSVVNVSGGMAAYREAQGRRTSSAGGT